MARLEGRFQEQAPDRIAVYDYIRGELKRQAPHFWLQGTSGTSGTPAPGQDGREARKGAAQVDVRLTAEEQKKRPEERLNIFREREAAAARRGQG